jgi:hypothetical protein
MLFNCREVFSFTMIIQSAHFVRHGILKGMSGFPDCAEIKKHSLSKHIYIINNNIMI